MAMKRFYATGSFKYGTRMMQAGDPVDMDGPTARLYDHLGKITAKRPRAARVDLPAEIEAPAPKAPRKRRRK